MTTINNTYYNITAENGLNEIVFQSYVCEKQYMENIVNGLRKCVDVMRIEVVDQMTGEVIVDDNLIPQAEEPAEDDYDDTVFRDEEDDLNEIDKWCEYLEAIIQ